MRCAKATALLVVMLGGSLCVDLSPLPTLPSVPAADAPASEFAKVGVSFVEKHCVHCHGAKTQKADLSLHTYRDDLSVLKNRKAWQNVVHMVQSGEMPPKGRPRPEAADVDQFLKTVKAVFAKGDATRDPGRVTVRRLNKAEYNNTIRDLMGGGVDFNPAEDFPADDVGHGFDNIGDVLSLPPVLLERYLAAAESIVGRSFLAEPPKPSVRHQSARYLEPAGPNVPQTRFRPITKGNLNTLQRANMDGEYTIRARVFANQVGDEPVRIALLNDGKELQQFEVKATEDKKAERFEAS